MAFLVVSGTTIPVDTQQATREEDEVGGQDLRAFDGTLLSTQRWVKRSATVTTPALSAAEQTTVLALMGTGKTVTGDMFGGSVVCTVRCKNGPYRRSWALAVKRRLTITVREE